MTWYGAHGVQSGARGDAQRLEDSLRGAFTSSSLPGLLRYEDRNSMASSRESRVPFLTPALVDLAFRLPAAHKIAPDGTTKVAFRAAMRGIVPDAVLDRRDKIGFTTPRAWEVEAVARAAELLADTEAAGRLGIDVVALRAWATRRPSAASAAAVWRAVNAQRWAHLFEMSA
jgi:asparagine synthase (glutamine-hydrolysing)